MGPEMHFRIRKGIFEFSYGSSLPLEWEKQFPTVNCIFIFGLVQFFARIPLLVNICYLLMLMLVSVTQANSEFFTRKSIYCSLAS